MELTFFGADKEVTGSCHCLTVNGKHILIDCGLQQGADEIDNADLAFHANLVDYVLITHAHIDHSGRLPLLVKQGFQGKILSTRKTTDLMKIMLRDSAHIQVMDAEQAARKGKRAGRKPKEPLYTLDDAEDAIQLMESCEYKEMVELFPGVKVRFVDAGHLLGSSSIEVWATEKDITRKLVFSGDIGNKNQPIIRNPQYIKEADYVVMESTYGDREHDKEENYPEVFAKIIDNTLANGGNVVIPSFAVGRTQELLYFIREIKEKHLTPQCPNFPVYVDSPLAAEATAIYSGDLHGYADEETADMIMDGFEPLQFPNLNITNSVEESKALNEDGIPKVIISSSGMCEAGRIRHHLKHNLWRPECAIVFVGFQANGTLGRMLIDSVDSVKLFGEQIAVKAHIYNFRALSGHADHTGLLEWISSFETKPRKVFVVHGERACCEGFTAELCTKGYDAYAPNFSATYDLIANRMTDEGITPEILHPAKPASGKGKYYYSPAFKRLVQAQKRLEQVVQHNEGGTNKDLGRFADQILAMCEKWDR
ncbi:MAG: MBL fold metallo-hydrolase [Oscillospiraceae bacterium]|jgi:metallo-beta-lactamase family protein|nr:MBL fold metallo-hydrolase [Oscillospiraceae bacterium]